MPLISHPIVDEAGNASWFSFASEPGGFSGDGTSRLITGPDFGFYVQGRLEQTDETPDYWDKLEVSVAGGSGYDERFRIDLSAPLGERLQKGTYPLAGNHLRRPEAQLDLGMNGHSCGDSTGSFTVHDIDDEVSRLWVTFEWFCGGSRPALTGELRLNEPVMPGMTGADEVLLPGLTVGGLNVSGMGRACAGRVSSFRITEVGYDLTGKLVRMALSFRHRCVDDTGDLRGAIAWHALGPPPDVPGGYDDDGGTDVPPGTGTTQPTMIVLRAVDRPSGRIVVGGHLVSAGLGVSYARVLFERRTTVTGKWRRGGHVTTAANGRFRRSLSTRHTVAIRVSFRGAGGFAAARPQVIWLR